jgi:hypothetical protein
LFVRFDGGPILAAQPITLSQHYESDLEIFTSEAQHIWQTGHHTLIGGVRFQNGDIHTESTQTRLPAPLARVPSQSVDADLERVSLYAYDNWALLPSMTLVGGVTYDHLTYPENFRLAPLSTGNKTRDQTSPKAGLIWTPTDGTTMRGDYSRSLGGMSIDQSYQLEPSQVAGFNQLYRSLIPEAVAGANAGAGFDTWNLTLEQRFETGTYLGLGGEWLESSVDRTVGVMEFDIPSSPGPATFQRDTPQKLKYRERSLMFTANQLLGEHVAVGARYRLSHAKLNSKFPAIPEDALLAANFLASDNVDALLHHVDLFAIYQLPCGFFSRFDARWWSQSNRGYELQDLAGDDFWQFNVHAGYRFARRKAEIRVSLLNITDQNFRLNPLNLTAEPPRERTLAVNLKLDL